MRYFLILLSLTLSVAASQRVVNWMELPSHHLSPIKQFYLELEFHNPSIWVSDWGEIDSQGRIDITTTSDPNAIVIQVLYTAGYAYTIDMDSIFDSNTISIFVDGVELVDFNNTNKIEFEYSQDLNNWNTVTVPVDTGSYFLRIKDTK